MAPRARAGERNFLQKILISAMIFAMDALKEEPRQAIEPEFLSQALTSGVKLRIGQMNKTEHEGILRDIGRYEINLEVNGTLITLLKQEISYLTSPHPLLVLPPHQRDADSEDAPTGRPNIQQEFLDKAIKDNQLLTLYLINGQRIKAYIEAYDSFTVLLKEGGRQHLYYKHSITTINR
jgi:host factor-I protein